MNDVLSEIGKSLADKWFSLLVLPGALFLAVATAAHALGQAHALDPARLGTQITAWARDPAASSVGGQVVLLGAVLGGSTIAGLIARALGAAVERFVLAADWRTWPEPLRGWATRRVQARRKRWEAELDRAGKALALGQKPYAGRQGGARANLESIAPEYPDRPTWSGDRIHAAAVRINRDLGFDLGLVWPYLWLTLPAPQHDEISAARDALTRAATLGAWAVLYIPLTIMWWPAALAAFVLAMTARIRIRAAADTYARLLEATARLNAPGLPEALGLVTDPGLTPSEIGKRVNDLLAPPRKPWTVEGESGENGAHESR